MEKEAALCVVVRSGEYWGQDSSLWAVLHDPQSTLYAGSLGEAHLGRVPSIPPHRWGAAAQDP